MDFTAIFLGSGTSTGVPMIGCECPICKSEEPMNKRTRSSLYVETPECRIIIDTGPDLREQCLREGIKEADAAIFTHAHIDHIAGFDDLRRFTHGDSSKIAIYAARPTMEKIQSTFNYAFSEPNPPSTYIKAMPHYIEGDFMLGNTLIKPFGVDHANLHTMGFVFEREGRKLLAYASDCKKFHDGSWPIVEGVDTLIIDGLHRRPHPTHMNFDEAIEVFHHLKPRNCFLTHLTHEVDHFADAKTLPNGVNLAYDGLKLQWSDTMLS